MSVAKIFWKEKKVHKARKWFDRAVGLNPDIGDSWIYYYAFEEDTTGKTQEIISNFVKAGPKHGKLWIGITKKPENWGKPLKELLGIAAKGIKDEIDKIE